MLSLRSPDSLLSSSLRFTLAPKCRCYRACFVMSDSNVQRKAGDCLMRTQAQDAILPAKNGLIARKRWSFA
eukprot:1491626-Rhodomonas_salina.1